MNTRTENDDRPTVVHWIVALAFLGGSMVGLPLATSALLTVLP